jgi:hypothetical protein
LCGRSLRRLKDAAVRDDAGDYAGVVKGAAKGDDAVWATVSGGDAEGVILSAAGFQAERTISGCTALCQMGCGAGDPSGG